MKVLTSLPIEPRSGHQAQGKSQLHNAITRTVKDIRSSSGFARRHVVRAVTPCFLASALVATGVSTAEAGTIRGRNYQNVPIPDAPATGARSIVEITDAPSGSTITGVKVRYDIRHTYVGDLEVWLTTQYGGQWHDFRLRGRSGGAQDDIYETKDGLDNWNGASPNQTWYLVVKDKDRGDTGYIDEFDIWVTYAERIPVQTGDQFEPDDTTSRAKTIRPGERQNRSLHSPTDVDWAKFTLTARSDVRIATDGSGSDTELWLYRDSDLNRHLDYDDDGGNGYFSAINRSGGNALNPGTYYVKVGSYGSQNPVPAYALTLSTTARNQVAAPTIEPRSGRYDAPITLTARTATPGASVRYTINGPEPSAGSPVLPATGVRITSTATVRLRSFSGNLIPSENVEVRYEIVPRQGTIAKNVPVTGIAGDAASAQIYRISVPAGQRQLSVRMYSGVGNANLYLRRGQAPTTTLYHKRSVTSTTEEFTAIANPEAGDWYLLVYGASRFSGVSLIATYWDDRDLRWKLPLPGGHAWKCSTEAGGQSSDNNIDSHHTGRNWYSLDFSFRTENVSWPANQEIPIYALHHGRVIEVGFNRFNGNFVRLDMDNDGQQGTGFGTVYLHLKWPAIVRAGDQVTPSTLLGYMGKTGRDSTAEHLHVGFIFNGSGAPRSAELDKITIEGLQIRDFRCRTESGSPVYYRSTHD